MPCTSASTLTSISSVPVLPQLTGLSAGDRQALTRWGQQLLAQIQAAGGATGVNVVPQQYALVAGSTLPPIASTTNCTVTLDASTQLFGAGSYKIAITGSPATVEFSAKTAWPIQANWQWIISFFQTASAAVAGSVTITTSGGTAYSTTFTTGTAGLALGRLFDVLNLGGDSSAAFGLSFTFTSATGQTVWLDGLQLEPYFGRAIQPSPFISTSPPLLLDNNPDGFYSKIMSSRTSGNVAYNFRGVWSSTADYLTGDEVVYETSYWLCLVSNTASAPATNNANWQVVGSYSGYQGAWSSTVPYVAGAEVTYNGNFWVCVTGNTNSAPTTSNANWQIAGPTSLDNIADGPTLYARVPISHFDNLTNRNLNTDYAVPGTGTGATTLAVVGAQRNLVPDSGLKSASIYWPDQSSGAIYISQNYDGHTNCFKYVGTGGASGYLYRKSLTIPVSPGSYTLSAVVQGFYISTGSAVIGVNNTADTTTYGSLAISASTNGRISAQVTIPAGVTLVNVAFDTANATVALNEPLLCQQIQLEPGSVMTAYKETQADQLEGTVLVDLSNANHLGKNLGNIADGGGRFASLNGNAYGISSVDSSNRVSTVNGAMAPYGSIPPFTSNVQFTYSSTTSSITWSWPAMTVYRSDGTTTAVNAGSLSITGLTASTTYYSYPYLRESDSTIQFSEGYTNSVGSPAAAYTAASPNGAAYSAYFANAPLGTLSASTPASGTGGGGGNLVCCLSDLQAVELASGEEIYAADLEPGHELLSPRGPVRVRQVKRAPWDKWIRVTFSNEASVLVVHDHRFIDPSGEEVRASELHLHQIIDSRGAPVYVTKLEALEAPGTKVSIEVDPPHLYYVQGILSHNKFAC